MNQLHRIKSGAVITRCWTHPEPVNCSSSTKERGQRSRRTPVFSTCCRAGPMWVNPSRSTLRHRDSSNLRETHTHTQRGNEVICSK